ncbi:BMP family lipoprotein [Mycoplasmoides alvi]|uniref:BMP family lipoprotein n=1 Tax=Mycoplasmoides alvi TaxID=78580 RepID=UPI00051ABE3E|nr:BMP family ABC transporter substrate-binding protein [Mycoplasmoides alvi]
MKKIDSFQKNKINKKTKKIIKISTFSGLTASAIGIAAIASSCAGVSWKSTAQIVVSDSSSVLADQAFSESAYNGLKSFYSNLGISDIPNANSSDVVEGNGIWKRPGSTDQSRISAYENVKNDGSNIVIATGFNQKSALEQVTQIGSSNESLFGNTGFIFVDGAMPKDDKSNPRNVASISYRADEGSFLVGLATAVYLNENWDLFYSQKPESIGASSFVGLALDSTVSLFNGFRLGLMYWNSIADHITLSDGGNAIPIQWISPENAFTMDAYISGGFDPNQPKAVTITESLINKGAKVIFPIAGPQTASVVGTISQKQTNVAVIGVDTAQENITELQKPMPKPRNGKNDQILIFSSLKNLDISVNAVLNSIKSGQEFKPSGSETGYQGFGWNNIADLSNNGVGISDAGLSYLIDPFFFDSEQINDDTKTTYDASKGNKVQLSTIARAKDDNSIKQKYSKLLGGNVQVKYSSLGEDKNWQIQGSELKWTLNYTSSTQGIGDISRYMPIITGTSGNNEYTIDGAFGGTVTTQVATAGTLLDGTKWTYDITRS